MSNFQSVVLVDENDSEIGHMEKIQAHVEGALHRAFSIFIFDLNGNLLLQKRAFDKYHSSGLWTNTCCGHPIAKESILKAAQRRLMEEMGMECPLIFGFKFTYKSEVGNNLIEHEIDHVFFGISNKNPQPNNEEVAACRSISLKDLQNEINLNPKSFTEWFKMIYEKAFNFHLLEELIKDTKYLMITE